MPQRNFAAAGSVIQIVRQGKMRPLTGTIPCCLPGGRGSLLRFKFFSLVGGLKWNTRLSHSCRIENLLDLCFSQELPFSHNVND